MCAGALVNARVERLVTAPATPRPASAAAWGTWSRIPGSTTGWRWWPGILEADSAALLREFFAGLRLGERAL